MDDYPSKEEYKPRLIKLWWMKIDFSIMLEYDIKCKRRNEIPQTHQ